MTALVKMVLVKMVLMKRAALLLFLSSLVGIAPVYAADYTITQVSSNLYTNTCPEINAKGHIVWQGSDGSDDEIFLYNGNNVTRLTDNDYADSGPRINVNEHVVWQGNGEIFLYVDNAVTQLTNNSYNDYSPKISANGYVTWCGDENSNEKFCGDPLRSDSEIFLYDKTIITRLTDNHYEDIAPQINADGQVVWCGHDGADWEIFLYDGITVARLTNNSRQDLGPQINDSGHVVWYGRGEIFFYNGTDITQLSNNSTDLNPQINGKGHIVWQHYDGHDYEIFLYDGSAGTQLTDNSFDDLHPRINDSGHVVWYGDARVFVYDGSTITGLITGNPYGDWSPQINGKRQVAWQGQPGPLNSAVFLATPQCGTFSYSSNILHVPCFRLPGSAYWLQFEFVPPCLELKDFALNEEQINLSGCASFDFQTNILHIPCFDIEGTSYWVDLELTGSSPVCLDIKDGGKND